MGNYRVMDLVDQQAPGRSGKPGAEQRAPGHFGRHGAEQQAPRRLGYRPVLDGMRGIAVLLVMLMHTGVVDNGYIGVDVFFGLSGFLITTLLYEEWGRTGQISFRR